MKTIKTLLLVMSLILSSQVTAQKIGIIDITKKLNSDPDVSQNFITKTTEIAMCCIRDTMWISKKHGDKVPAYEKAISNGEAGKILSKSDIQNARAKFPGNDTKSRVSRFKMYLRKMERMTEDE